MDIKRGLCVGVVAISGVMASGAEASQFYGVTTTGVLTRFDMSAHTVATIGNIQVGPTSPTGFEDLEFGGNGQLYAVRGFSDGVFPPTNFNEVYRITNLATGSALLSASMSSATARRHANIAYRPSDGLFYSNRNSDGHLGTLDVTTGAFVDTAGVFNGLRSYVEALAVNPTTGLAYGIVDMGSAIEGTINYSLMSMNLQTGTASLIGSFGQGSNRFKALRFDDTGTGYTVNSNNGDVFTVNLSTGAATFVFAGGAAAVNTTGLAFVVPAPGGVAGLLLAGAVLAGRRRR
ncbi:MAG: hypothetical protein KF705_15245 [Phycisphaeraceae bacterium]|nr:hypothetical protein [Phycisphaeraceae bacterium]